MKKTITSILIVIASFYSAEAQIDQKLIRKIDQSLVAYFNTYGRETFELRSFKDRAFAFGFLISINKNGNVDTVIFSNRTKTLDSLVSFKNIVKELKKQTIFSNYKNTLLFSTALVRRGWDDKISNTINIFNRGREDYIDFDTYMYRIIPTMPPSLSNKKIVLLPAFSLSQAGTIH